MCHSMHSLFPLIAKTLRATNSSCPWTERNVPYEKVTILQRSCLPLKHWEHEGSKAQKETYFVQSQELFIAFPNIQEHENKEQGGAKYLSLEMQFSTGSTSDLFSPPGRGQDFQAGGCRLMLAAGLPWACLSLAGMEIAAFLSDKAGAISVVERKEFPFQHALGPQVGGVALKVRKIWREFLGWRTHGTHQPCELPQPGKPSPCAESEPCMPSHLAHTAHCRSSAHTAGPNLPHTSHFSVQLHPPA